MKNKVAQWIGQEAIKLIFIGLAGLIGWIWSFIATVPMLDTVKADVEKALDSRDTELANKMGSMENKLDRVILYLCIKEKIRDTRICN